MSGVRRWDSCLVGLCLLLSEAVQGAVRLERNTECLDDADLRTRLEVVLSEFEGRESVSVGVSDAPAVEGVLVRLRVVLDRCGEILLDRQILLKPSDCPSLGALVEVILRRFFKELPRERWVEIPRRLSPPERIIVEKDITHFDGLLPLSLSGRMFPWGSTFEVGLEIQIGSALHRFTGGASLRVSSPNGLGEGQYQESAALLGVGYAYRGGDFAVRLGVKTGGLLVVGYGYQINYQRWLLSLELQVSALWRFRSLWVGPDLGLSAPWNGVTTSDGITSQLSWVRLGLVVAFALWERRVD